VFTENQYMIYKQYYKQNKGSQYFWKHSWK